MARTNKKGGNTAGLKGWKSFSMENNSNNKPDGRAGSSAFQKMDPPETQAKIKKMIVSGIEKGMDDRDIMKKIRSMTDGSKEYTYNRKTKEVRVYPKGRSGFEGELETDPDKG